MKAKILFLSITFLGLFVLAQTSQAATLYVSPTGSDTNSGTSTAPFKTIQKCATAINGGDTCILRDGTYSTIAAGYNNRLIHLSSSKSGSSAAYTTFKAEHKGRAIIDGSNLPTSDGTYGIFINGASYVKIEDLVFTGANTRHAIFGANSAHHVYIKGNDFHGINRRTDCNAWGGTYTIGGGPIYTGEGTSYWTVDSNLFYDSGRTNGSPNPCSDPPGDVSYNHDHHWYMKGLANHGNSNHLVINNIFYRAYAGWGVALSSGVSGVKIINNTFYGSNSGREGQIIADEGNQNVIIENNIFYQNESGDEGAIRTNSTLAVNCVARYNIFYNSSGSMYAICGPQSGNNACPQGSPPGWTFAANISGQDSKFIDSGNKNLHLQSTSPAIGKGLTTNAPTIDYDGVPRGSSIDIGAYEYVGSDTTPPAVPSGLQVR